MNLILVGIVYYNICMFLFMIYSVRFDLYYKNITKLKTMTFETRLINLQYKYDVQ